MDRNRRTTLLYLKLALLCDRRRQLPSRDRLLVCAADAALNAGWPQVAEGCRAIILRSNRHHLLRRWPTFRDAVLSAEFRPLLERCRRFCPVERAEFLLQRHHEEVERALRSVTSADAPPPAEADRTGPDTPALRQAMAVVSALS
ncbi:MAG: hypothetical protein D6725_00990 [Planctomycetota bacterium]|nr:MAG: hypothetical protein D6725_00990 [Planctomycetota bacterium]